MTIVSNDPGAWLYVTTWRVSSYYVVGSSVGVTYDWALTFGQEIELIWRQRWSLMTVLYLCVRYIGIIYAVMNILINVPTILLTDAGCWILYIVMNWTGVLVFPMLRVILIARIYAMYQRSRKMLVFLVITFLADTIFNIVIATLSTKDISGEEYILSGTYECIVTYGGGITFLDSITWICGTAWEVVVLCLAVWIAIKHFRELRQTSSGGPMTDCFTVLMKTQVLYFMSFVAVSCFNLVMFLSPTITVNPSTAAGIDFYYGSLQILSFVQMFVLGPRLVLSVREFNAKLVTDSDAATGMTSIAFQERVNISTGSGV